MDPFSLSLGVLTVVQTAAQAAEALYDFVKTVRDAPEEIQNLLQEANSLYGVLRRINEALQDPVIAAYVSKNSEVEKDLSSLKDPLKHCEKRMGEFMVKLEKSTDRGTSGDRTIKSLRWYFVKDDVNTTRNDLAHTRDIANLTFSGLNFLENLRDRANKDSTDPPPEKATPSSLSSEVRELASQGRDLRFAAKEGDNRRIKLLLDAGVPIESKNWDDRTALSIAAEYGNTESVKLLIDRNASINAAAKDYIQGGYSKNAEARRTALHWAAARGHTAVAELLLDADANIEALTRSQRTPVQEAASMKHLKTVKFLLERGANVNTQTYYGWSMMHTAAETGNVNLGELLLSHDASVEAVYRKPWHGEGKNDATHQRPLHYALRPKDRPKDTAMIELLMSRNAQLSAKDSQGVTAIQYAVRARWIAALDVLLRHASKGDLLVRDSTGNGPLDDAINLGDQDIIERLKLP